MNRNIESFLASPHHRSREFNRVERFQQNLQASASDLEVLWQASGEFHNAVIEERGPYFQGMGHAHPIAFVENVIAQVKMLIEMHESEQAGGCGCFRSLAV